MAMQMINQENYSVGIYARLYIDLKKVVSIKKQVHFRRFYHEIRAFRLNPQY